MNLHTLSSRDALTAMQSKEEGLSGKEAKKADRLRSKFFDTEDSFYSTKLQELVEKTGYSKRGNQ